MEIHLSSDTAIYAMGWYGTCEDEEPFPIASIEDKISGVLQLNEFGSVLDRYDPDKASWKTHPFEFLNRGYSYIIIFKIVDANASDEEKKVVIPGFVSAKHQGKDRSVYPPVEKSPGEGHGRVILDCDLVTPSNSVWISFSATDVNTDNHFTSWHELEVSESEGYTKLVPKQSELLNSDISNFQGTNLLNIALIQSENPNSSLDATKIFGSGDVDMSCKECGSSLPRLILMDSSDNKFIYTDRIYKSSEICSGSNQLSTKTSSNWYGAPVVYNTINAPQKSITIKELYFDVSGGSKLKFEGFKC
jgi:hypothetical protein